MTMLCWLWGFRTAISHKLHIRLLGLGADIVMELITLIDRVVSVLLPSPHCG